ncbi:MAG: multidrug resistance protein family [Alphaproteobacteria bacterium]|nr:multidrug resistance protein family [Alphaproteobacteria bacterium]
MTTSPPSFPITHARVFAIAGPAMLANLTTPLLGIVNTAAIGRLGEPYLIGGVALAAVVFDGIYWLFGFVRMGTVALTAQAVGASDVREQRAVLSRALLVAIAIGLALVALQAPLASAAYGLLGGSAEVRQAAESYFFVRIWAAPFTLGNLTMLGWLIGQARTGTALALQIAINSLNIVLTVALVLGLDFGIAGAAFAAATAEAVGFAAGLVVAWRLLGGRFELEPALVFQRQKLLRMLAVNRDIMIRTAGVIGAFSFFASQGARAGDAALAANAVLHNFVMIGSFFLDGMATAAEQLCGRSVGARDRSGFLRATRLSLGWGLCFGAASSVVFLVGGNALIDLMTTSAQVRSTAREFMLFAALAPMLGALAYTLDGVYIGATWARDMRNLMMAAFAIYLATWWALHGLGNTGLWIAILTFLMARGVLQAMRYPALLRATFP